MHAPYFYKLTKPNKKKIIVETVTNYTHSLLENSFWFLVIHNTAKEDELLNYP